MKPSLRLFAMLAALAAPASVHAAGVPVSNLSGWTVNTLGDSGRAIRNHVEPVWDVSPDGTTAGMTTNGRPSVLRAPDSGNVGRYRGTISVGIDDGRFVDNDFVGFVFGYDEGEINSVEADFWLIDWKQSGQNLQPGTQVDVGYDYSRRQSDRGLSLSRVRGDLDSFKNELNFWSHTSSGPNTSSVTRIADGRTLGDTGWETFETYRWFLEYTDTSIFFSIDGVTQFDIALPSTTSVTNSIGGFGLYAFSQDQIFFTAAPAPVPVPASLPLLLAGLGGLALIRRRRRG